MVGGAVSHGKTLEEPGYGAAARFLSCINREVITKLNSIIILLVTGQHHESYFVLHFSLVSSAREFQELFSRAWPASPTIISLVHNDKYGDNTAYYRF